MKSNLQKNNRIIQTKWTHYVNIDKTLNDFDNNSPRESQT